MKTIKATPNYSKKTFTIRTYWNKVLTGKYRTLPMSSIEFLNTDNNTESDWKEFLKRGEYYTVRNF